MPPFWGVLLGRQRQRRRRDAKAPSGFSLSSEAAAAAEVQAAAEAAAGSGAAAGECGVRRITGRGMEGGKREAGGRRRGAGPVRAATGHRALRARSLPVSRTPGTRPRTARNSGPIRVRLARVPAPRETRPPRGHALTPLPFAFTLQAPRAWFLQGTGVVLSGSLCEIPAVCPRCLFPDPAAPRVLGVHPWGCPRFPLL